MTTATEPRLSPSEYAALPFINTYSGVSAGLGHGVPTLQDIAISLGRLCRYAGHGVAWYPVLLHSMLVADLVSPEALPYALLHDAAESVIGDIPTPFKTPHMANIEGHLLENIYASLGIMPPTSHLAAQVKLADKTALHAEVWTVGTYSLRKIFTEREPAVENMVLDYRQKYPSDECLNPSGRAVLDFMRRVSDVVDGASGRNLWAV